MFCVRSPPKPDPFADAADEAWAVQQRSGRTTDAILSCPSCFTTLCIDCQQHEHYHTQVGGWVRVWCGVDKGATAPVVYVGVGVLCAAAHVAWCRARPCIAHSWQQQRPCSVQQSVSESQTCAAMQLSEEAQGCRHRQRQFTQELCGASAAVPSPVTGGMSCTCCKHSVRQSECTWH